MSAVRMTMVLAVVLVAACKHDAGRPATGQPATGQPMTAQSAPAREAAVTVSFEDTDIGSLPSGWRVAETSSRGTPATWAVAAGQGLHGGKRVLRVAETKNSGRTFNLLLSPVRFPADLVLRTDLHASRGAEDQGGGLLWRAQDADNYYVTRWNPLENNLRLYKVVGGRRSQLCSADITVDSGQWHTLEVEVVGQRMRVRFDDKEELSFEDATFANGGRVGFWTKADAATMFDDLKVRTDLR